MEFFPTWELLDYPDHARFVRNVFDCSNVSLKNRGVNIYGYWNNDLNVVSDTLLLELGACLDDVLNLGFGEVLDGSCALDQRLNMRVYPVRHQLEFSIRWDESNETLCVKFIESHTLMELDVLHLNQFVP